jgi:hydrogenase nickel incorporation protein HypB
MAIQTIVVPPEETSEIELEYDLFDANAKVAEENRALLEKHGVASIDFMGAIGSGKTTLIIKLVEKLKSKIGLAVLNGDPTTTNDYDALAGQDVPIIQIATNGCHLDAQLVSQGLGKINLGQTALVFIENVGNLICPAEFPLGSKARVVVISVTEGPYMVRKHPRMFLGADLVVINKTDLAEVMGVRVEQLAADVHRLKPGLKVVAASAKNGVGVDEIAMALLAN